MSKFNVVRDCHSRLYEQLAEGNEPHLEALEDLIDQSLELSPLIENIEDREELRHILRFWGGYLSSHGKSFPDIDIDRADRLPEKILTRPAQKVSQSVKGIRKDILTELFNYLQRIKKRSEKDLAETMEVNFQIPATQQYFLEMLSEFGYSVRSVRVFEEEQIRVGTVNTYQVIVPTPSLEDSPIINFNVSQDKGIDIMLQVPSVQENLQNLSTSPAVKLETRVGQTSLPKKHERLFTYLALMHLQDAVRKLMDR